MNIFLKEDIEKILPHRGKALLIDQIIFFENGNVKGAKLIFVDDKNFEGHFPEILMYPGHCLDEMQCLVAAALIKLRFPEVNGLPVVVSKNGVHYKKAVVPGDLLTISVFLLENKFNRLFDFRTEIHNQNGELVAMIENIKGIAAKSPRKKEADG